MNAPEMAMATAGERPRERWRNLWHNPAMSGAMIWIVGVLLVRPSPFDIEWAQALLLFAPLVLVPMGIERVAIPSDRLWRTVTHFQLPSALALGWAFLLPKGVVAAALATPWFAVTALIAVQGLLQIFRHRNGPISEVCLSTGLVYLSFGSGWAVLDRLGVRPLDFDEVIVLLTAIHFHYAGFALPIMTGLIVRRIEATMSRVTALCTMAAVPTVAIGITVTQLGHTPLWECLAAWFLAICGMIVGGLYLTSATKHDWPSRVRACWMVCGTSLIASMILAAMYGTRSYAPVEWLDIPWMRALHGTANALGFGFCGLAGWAMAGREPSRSAGIKPSSE